MYDSPQRIRFTSDGEPESVSHFTPPPQRVCLLIFRSFFSHFALFLTVFSFQITPKILMFTVRMCIVLCFQFNCNINVSSCHFDDTPRDWLKWHCFCKYVDITTGAREINDVELP